MDYAQIDMLVMFNFEEHVHKYRDIPTGARKLRQAFLAVVDRELEARKLLNIDYLDLYLLETAAEKEVARLVTLAEEFAISQGKDDIFPTKFTGNYFRYKEWAHIISEFCEFVSEAGNGDENKTNFINLLYESRT